MSVAHDKSMFYDSKYFVEKFVFMRDKIPERRRANFLTVK
jgi:hypothetical protein